MGKWQVGEVGTVPPTGLTRGESRGQQQINRIPRLRDAYQWPSVSSCWGLPPSPDRGGSQLAYCAALHVVVGEQ